MVAIANLGFLLTLLGVFDLISSQQYHHENAIGYLSQGKGCRGLGHCCQGKNNTCVATGPRMNGVKSGVCFCDSSCLHLGDCCTDYNQVCTAIDCVLGHWKVWEACDTNCGWGHKHRRRDVLVPAQNGGAACEKTVEKLHCYGWNCKAPRHSFSMEELRETAKVIPGMYGGHRATSQYSPFHDIRRNLFYHYKHQSIINRPTYCATFEIMSSRKSCEMSDKVWAPQLRKGALVCVECQSFSMKKRLGVRCKGHGVFKKDTRWTAMTVPGCHGTWNMQTKHTKCSCADSPYPGFVLI